MHNYSLESPMNGAHNISASVVGGTGYSGEELLKILARHPAVHIDGVFAQASAGKKLSEVSPAFAGVLDTEIEYYDGAASGDSELFFLALPSGQAMNLVPELLKANKKVIDLSGDYRLPDALTYERYYGHAHASHELTSQATYSIPELHAKSIVESSLIANPGCYPTSAILPLAPLVKEGVIHKSNIVINSLSGVTGAGKKATQELSFAEIDSSVKAYKVTEHQHIPEIEHALSIFAGGDVSVSFTPHLIPIRRGIYTTIVADLNGAVTDATIEKIFRDYYNTKYFVRLRDNQVPEIKHVVHSNFIDIGWKVDERTNKVVLMSAIDNLLKGAAGQAVQNMNILFGLPEETALN